MNYRTYDGSFNNLNNTTWGAANSHLIFSGTHLGYANLIDQPTGANRPNPRRVSNSIFAQDAPIFDTQKHSDFVWVFGQFIDHEFGLTPDGDEPMNIPVPQGDPLFDPFNTGQAFIPMVRNLFDPATGTNTQNPRRHVNTITAYIDGSAVYGSDDFYANWLRSFQGGKLKVSAGNLPPFNTFNGEYDAPVDPSAPHVENPVGLTERVFICGDPRAAENPVLLAMHTLFVREHNRLCDELADKNPTWNDEQLYQHARKLVGGLIQSITYDEWLPTVGVDVPAYQGYNPNLEAQVFNVFTAAAFRVGHTLLNGQLLRISKEGEDMPEGHMLLRDAFFNPYPVMDMGIEPFFQGMGVQMMQAFDHQVMDDVRNFLFGPPGAGGLDLVSINIQRGRERGLKDFNTVRHEFGLPRYTFFQQINDNQQVYAKLIGLYGDVNNIDPWVGMMTEKAAPGSIFGPTLNRVLSVQFARLRDGDRFYYENDPVLSDEEKAWIKNTTLNHVIMKNTNMKLMQDNVFDAMDYNEICEHMTANISGLIFTEAGVPVPDVIVNVLNTTGPMQTLTAEAGDFAFLAVPACDVTMVGMERDDDLTNGVSTADLIRLQQHILGLVRLDSPYKMIAADVNRSGTITVLDQIQMRRVILGQSTAFPNNFSWRFVDAHYEFQTDEPQGEDFTEIVTVEDVLSLDMDLKFIAVKVGDVTGDADPDGLQPDDIDNRSMMVFKLQDMALEAGQTYDIPVTVDRFSHIQGYQFGLDYEADELSFVGIKPGTLPALDEDNFGVFPEDGQLTTSWVKPLSASIDADEPLFYLSFRALKPIRLSQALSLSEAKLKAEAYTAGSDYLRATLAFEQANTEGMDKAFALYQNHPNPFKSETVIPFRMAEEGWARLTLTDVNGKVLLVREGDFAAGDNQWQLSREQLPANGLFFYTVETDNDSATQRMIAVE